MKKIVFLTGAGISAESGIPTDEYLLDCRIANRSGFRSDEERDSAMTTDSDFDIAFVKDNRWDSGTAQNIKRRNGI